MLKNGGPRIPAALLAMLVGVTLNVLAFAVTFGQLQARVMGLEGRLGRIEERLGRIETILIQGGK